MLRTFQNCKGAALHQMKKENFKYALTNEKLNNKKYAYKFYIS